MCESAASKDMNGIEISARRPETRRSEGSCSFHLQGTGAVAELEKQLREHYKMPYALAVSSGSSGLLGLALAIGLRDAEFIAPAYGYGATLGPWLTLGNRVRFADVDRSTLGLDPASAKDRLTDDTKAILAVDLFGVPADMRAIRQLADDGGLWYIADAAQSLGAWRDGVPAGSLADAVVVSFTYGKTVFGGEGGAVITRNRDLYEKLIWYTQHPDRQRRELGLGLANEFGLNCRIHPVAAKWANESFKRDLEYVSGKRDRCFEAIDLLNAIGCTETIRWREDGILPAFFRFAVSWEGRPRPAKLFRELKANGFDLAIEEPSARVYYRHPAYKAQFRPRGDHFCPVAEHQERSRFCLRGLE